MRYSYQRELVLKEVLQRRDYPSAEDICTSLRKSYPRLSLGTVYRDLNVLVEIGKIDRITIPGLADRFAAPKPNTQQFYCRKCHRIRRIPMPDAGMRGLLSSCSDVQPEVLRLTLFGLCPKCAAKQDKAAAAQ